MVKKSGSTQSHLMSFLISPSKRNLSTGISSHSSVEQNLTEKNIVKIDRELWLIFNSVKTGIEVKLPLNLLFGGKALNILTKYQNKWNTFFSLKSNSNINKELIRIGKLANIDKHFSFHTARHTNATLLIYKGANITTVQKLLGHKNLTTTQIYGEVMGSTIVRDLKKCQKGKD